MLFFLSKVVRLKKVHSKQAITRQDDMLDGICRWCSHLANASEAAPATASLPFRRQQLAISGFDFQHGVSYQCSILMI